MKTLSSALQPWMPSALYHTTSMPKVSHCSWGSIPSQVALYWGLNPQCCTSELRSQVVLKVCLSSTTHYLIFCFCLTAVGRVNDIRCINKNEIFLGTDICFLYLKIHYLLFKIWKQSWRGHHIFTKSLLENLYSVSSFVFLFFILRANIRYRFHNFLQLK